MQISGSIRCWRMTSTDVASAFMSSIALIEADILKVDGLLVDAHRRRRNPVREPAGLDDAAHQRRDECAVLGRSQPLALMRGPLGRVDDASVGRDARIGQRADLAVERL